MMIPETMRDVLKKEGVVAITTLGKAGPHMVNTWNTYIRITEEGHLLMPVGHMNLTQANIEADGNVLLTFGSREVAGKHGPGTGFLVKGTAKMLTSGSSFDVIKASFKWARAVLVVTPASITQTL